MGGREECPWWVLNRMTEEPSSGRSDLGSVLSGRGSSRDGRREPTGKEEYGPERRYHFLTPSFSPSDTKAPCSPQRPDSTSAGSIFRMSGNDTNLYTNFFPITFLMIFWGGETNVHFLITRS